METEKFLKAQELNKKIQEFKTVINTLESPSPGLGWEVGAFIRSSNYEQTITTQEPGIIECLLLILKEKKAEYEREFAKL